MTGPDRDLGLGRPISRRDFLDGVAFAAGAAMAGSLGRSPLQSSAYPPALTGLRGSHVGSFEALHTLRDGRFWATAGDPSPTGEEYDLVIVGAGISGLAAAYYYRKARPDARVLVLDNHDDFGGHAKRNEFSHDGRTYLGYGGTQSIDSPLPYSEIASALVTELGVDVAGFGRFLDPALYRSLGLGQGFFFDRETFGADRLVAGDPWRGEVAPFLAAAPLADEVRRDCVRLGSEGFDPFPGLSSAEKRAQLARISYADFLTVHWKLDPRVIPLLTTATHGLFGAGIDAVPAQDAFGLGLPGFRGMGLDPAPGPGQNYDSMGTDRSAAYYFHFPDGNATLARLLVRQLVPGGIPGRTAADIVTARARYDRLDQPGTPVRIRLRSPVVSVAHRGRVSGSDGVSVGYVERGRVRTVTGRAAILACWHTAIPAICPELPARQKEALAFAIKVPLVYTNVFMRRWTAFEKLGVSGVTAPGLWHTSIGLDYPVSIGGYRHQTNPAEPIVLHLSKSACQPGLPIREQHRAGRHQLFTTPFETIERSIRTELARVLGPGGFDPAADILAITVNRWPHGYAYQYNSLFDDFWLAGGEQPCRAARRPFGRIAIANADAGAYSYTDGAIDHAHRAVAEALELR